jgi:DNA-binding LacI/PurR family transcriptional regulator
MATIKDVAQRAGVSVSTISHALTGKRPVKEKTRRRIFEAIEELGYRPNLQAQALVTGYTQIIALLFPYEYDGESATSTGLSTIQLEMIWEADMAVQASGYNLQLYSKPDAMRDLRSICQNSDGLLVSMVSLHDERIEMLLNEGKPFVMLGRPEEPGTYAWVDTDFEDMVMQQLAHLVSLGHRAIAFLDNETLVAKDLSYTVRSRQAYYKACEAFDLEPHVVSSGASIEQGRQVMGKILRKHPDLTALAAFNDLAAVGAYYALLARGYNIPEDFSIITFTSPSLLRATCPHMTAMLNTGPLVSKTATEMLLTQLNGGTLENNQILIQSEMILGNTTGPVPSSL